MNIVSIRKMFYFSNILLCVVFLFHASFCSSLFADSGDSAGTEHDGVGEGVSDPLRDTDNDGISDHDETVIYHTDIHHSDTDNDGAPDGWEITYGFDPNIDDLSDDHDGDSLTRYEELGIYHTNPDSNDTDNDGLLDGEEISLNIDPNIPDTDNDGLGDGWEIQNGLDPKKDDSDADADNDGLKNSAELAFGTMANRFDTDNDGLSDNVEVSYQGSSVRINTDTRFDQINPSVANSGDEYLVVWQSEHQDGGSGDIYAVLLDSSLMIKNAQTPINTPIDVTSINPAVATDGINYLVVWESHNDGSVSILSQLLHGISTVRQDRIGNQSGGFVNNFPSGQLYFWGGYQAQHSGMTTGLKMKIFDGAGAEMSLAVYEDNGFGYPGKKIAQTQSIIVPDHFSGWKLFPFAEPLGVQSGRKYWFAWGHNNSKQVYLYYDADNDSSAYRDYEWNPSSGYPESASVGMGRHESRGVVFFNYTVLDTLQKVGIESSLVTINTPRQLRPSVVFDGSDYVVVWKDQTDVFGVYIDNDGRKLNGPILLLTGLTDTVADVSLSANGLNYVLVWRDADGIHGQPLFFSSSGSRIQKALGNKTSSVWNNFPAGQLYFWGNYEAQFDGQSEGVWLKLRNGAGAQMSIAVYSDTGFNYPGNKIAQTQVRTVSDQFNGWFFFPFAEPIAVQSGRKYWFAWGHNNSKQVYLYYDADNDSPAYRDYEWNPSSGYPESAQPNMGTHESRAMVYMTYSSLPDVAVSLGSEISIPVPTAKNLSVRTVGSNYIISWEIQNGLRTVLWEQRFDRLGVGFGDAMLVASYSSELSGAEIARKAGMDSLIVWQADSVDAGYDIYGMFAKLGLATDPLLSDTDNDGLTDQVELSLYRTNPLASDTDNDTISDKWEQLYMTNPNNPDTDNDGAIDGEELSVGSDPLLPDTDNDGIKDGWEITRNLDPLVSDTDNDGQDDRFEVIAGSDPLDALSKFSMNVDRDVGNGTELTWQCKQGKKYTVYVGDTTDRIDAQYGEPITPDYSGVYRLMDTGIDADNDTVYESEGDIAPSGSVDVKSRFYRIVIQDDIF